MPRFMNQSLFNTFVYTVAFAEHVELEAGAETSKTRNKLISDYKKSFPTDDFEEELVECLGVFVPWLNDVQPTADGAYAWLNALRQASIDWNPNGTRKTKSIFGGTFFTAPRTKPSLRTSQFIKDTMLYYARINSGAIHGN
jgi:hypothetical protein